MTDQIPRKGKRQRNDAHMTVMIMAGALIIAVVIAAAWFITRPSEEDLKVWLGESDVPLNVDIIYPANANYCKTRPLPVTVRVSAKQAVNQPVVGYRSNSLMLAQTGKKQGRITFSALQAGAFADYTLKFTPEPEQLLHDIEFFPTRDESLAQKRQFDLRAPKLLASDMPNAAMLVNRIHPLSLAVANCDETPLENVTFTITPSSAIHIAKLPPYVVREAENQRGTWHVTIPNLSSHTVTPVQLSMIPRVATPALTLNMSVVRSEELSDSVTMHMGSVTNE